jgi:hypothetical protein
LGTLLDRYSRVTFDKEVARSDPQIEFVSFGHPLFEAVLVYVERYLTQYLRDGAIFTDPDGQRDGVLLFYEGEVRDGMNQVAGKRLFALFFSSRGDPPQAVNPAIVWDLQPGGTLVSPYPNLSNLQEQALKHVMHELDTYRADLLRERQRQAQIKEKYGLRSLNELIVQLDNDLVQLQIRKELGEDLDLVIHNKQQQKREYEQSKIDLQETIQREQTLTSSTPRLVGAIRVVPCMPSAKKAEMDSDAQIEHIGMEIAMSYERSQGRQPEDVSAQALGFDIRSIDPCSGETRYIEVKARAGVGEIAITPNEWFKAQRLGEDYYLYVIYNAATQPDLHCIQNPAARFSPQQHLEVRYILAPELILSKGDQSGYDSRPSFH